MAEEPQEETQTPETEGEQTPETNTGEKTPQQIIEDLSKENSSLQAQKEHWRTKAEKVQEKPVPEPTPSPPSTDNEWREKIRSKELLGKDKKLKSS